MGITTHFKLVSEYVKIAIASAMEYRASFLMQSITMILNDGLWLIFWWIFFTRFEVLNGWGMRELLMLYAFATTSFGIAGFLFGNQNHIANIIAEGKLDFYLSLPKNELFHMLISRSSAFAFGDLIFGVVLACLVFNLSEIPLYIFMSLIGVLIFVSFGILVGSLAFFWGTAEETSRSLFFGLMSFAMYPFPVFKGVARIIILSVIPAGFITGIPVELINNFSLKWFLLSILVTGILFLVAITVFKIGLRRYESGSMITVRV